MGVDGVEVQEDKGECGWGRGAGKGGCGWEGGAGG